MRDQAERLRQLVLGIQPDAAEEQMPEETKPEEKTPTRIIAITSGKGGVGKTNLSVNLALALIELGARVALMDADLGLANVDVLLGIVPQYTLKDALDGTADISMILCEGPGGINVIPGGSGVQELADLPEDKLDGFINSLQEIEHLFDYILIDTGAGISRSVTSFLYAADEVLLVSTPEPTSLTDAYAMAKTIFSHFPESNLGLIVNRAADAGEAQETYRKLDMAVHSFLGLELRFAGWIADDPIIARSVRAHKPLLLYAPNTSVARLFRQLARSIHEPPAVEVAEQPQEQSGVSGFFSKLRNLFKRDKGGSL